MSSLDNFKTTPLGRRLRDIIENEDNVRDMIALSRPHTQCPAVQAIGQQVEALGRQVRDDTVKQMIGRWVREVMEKRGWVPDRSGRVKPGNFFTMGMIYRSASR
jgi:hypothetical protein